MTAKALLYGPDLQSFCGAGKGRRRRPAIRRPSESRQQLVSSAGLLRCRPRRQENPSRPGFATGQPIRHCSYKLYGRFKEVSGFGGATGVLARPERASAPPFARQETLACSGRSRAPVAPPNLTPRTSDPAFGTESPRRCVSARAAELRLSPQPCVPL